MMDYNAFVRKVSRDIVALLPAELNDAVISAERVNTSRKSYFGLTVKPKDSSIGLCMNLRKYYEERKQVPYNEILHVVVKEIVQAIEDADKMEIPEIDDYDSLKHTLMIQLMPVAGNESLLAKIPHSIFEDFALIYCFVIQSKEGIASSLITNDMLEAFHLQAEQLFADAQTYAPINSPATLRSLSATLAEMAFGISADENMEDPNGFYVGTCAMREYGASCIFYPGFLKHAAERFKGDFYVLPSSVHEVLICSTNGRMSAKELLQMVRDVNQHEVVREDKLTDSIYYYDASAGELKKY